MSRFLIIYNIDVIYLFSFRFSISWLSGVIYCMYFNWVQKIGYLLKFKIFDKKYLKIENKMNFDRCNICFDC